MRKALDRILNIVGKAGETVITVGTKEAWMKQHGLELTPVCMNQGEDAKALRHRWKERITQAQVERIRL